MQNTEEDRDLYPLPFSRILHKHLERLTNIGRLPQSADEAREPGAKREDGISGWAHQLVQENSLELCDRETRANRPKAAITPRYVCSVRAYFLTCYREEVPDSRHPMKLAHWGAELGGEPMGIGEKLVTRPPSVVETHHHANLIVHALITQSSSQKIQGPIRGANDRN